MQYQGYNPDEEDRPPEQKRALAGMSAGRGIMAAGQANLTDSGVGITDDHLLEGFKKKVYLLVLAMLLLTAGWVALALFTPGLGKFIITTVWLFIVMLMLQIVITIVVVCCSDVAQRVPLNYALLLAYTACQSYVVGYFCCIYGYRWDYTPSPEGRQLILTALGATVGLVAVLAFLGTQKLCELTTWFYVVTGVALVSLMAPFMLFFPPLRGFFAWLMVVSVSVYLVFDVQMVEEGAYGLDGYVLAAVAVYTDVVQLFIYVLQALGSS